MTRRGLAVAAAVLAACASARAQEFVDARDLSESLAGIRAAAAAQKAAVRRPAPLESVMGAGRFHSESLPPAGAAPSAGADATPDVRPYPIRGVDISHYQGAVSWDLVKLAGLSFVYVKATEGVDGVDDQFASNWKGAAGAGMLKGAYHFYNFCKGGAAQADNFINTVPPDARALPMTVDLERSGDCKTMPQKAAFRKSFAAFVRKIQAAYGHRPVVYLNAAIYDQYFKDENDSYKLWIADTSHAAPALSDSASWTIWQYGWHGRVAGIPGEVDLDVFNGTPQMLASLTGPTDVLVASLR